MAMEGGWGGVDGIGGSTGVVVGRERLCPCKILPGCEKIRKLNGLRAADFD
jgi:hypothetical protein